MLRTTTAPQSPPITSSTSPTQNGKPSEVMRSSSGSIPTTNGTIYVSKPFRSRTTKKLRAMISFVPRTSHFDISNVSSGSNEFRGFFTLFWISIFLLVVQNYVKSFELHGYPIELAFAAMFSRDAKTLALSDAVLVLTTALCVPFAKALKRGWIKYYWTGAAIQYIFQLSVLFFAVNWTFNRQWPWVQSGFFTLHSLVMVMKMHSYMSINGYLQSVYAQYERTLGTLRERASEIGGWEKAIEEANAQRQKASSSITEEASPSMTPEIFLDGSRQSFIDGEMAIALRKKLMQVPTPGRETTPEENTNSISSDSLSAMSIRNNEAHCLVDHPNERISELAQLLVDLDSDLTTSSRTGTRWPENITMKNFADYQLIPTLVYELEYPRTNGIRPLYLFEKTVATFGTFALLYTITENFILPLVPTREQSFWRSMLDLALPFMIAYLLLFYIIFECICNGFAELSCFADRQFYEDWWNSTSWDEFARKWNKPVHTFLLRHVYASTISNYRASRTVAMFVTFFLSAMAHELVMIIVTKKFRLYLFILQIIQIPMIAIGRIPVIRRNKLMGNIVFWLGLYAGFPLLCVMYCAY